MKISAIVEELQQTMLFDDIVALYLNKISNEEVISQPNSVKYEALWTFNDDSKVYVDDYVFYNISK